MTDGHIGPTAEQAVAREALEVFIAYNKSFITLQPEMATPFFHEPAIFMSPQGVIVMTSAALALGVVSKIMADLKARQYKYTQLKNLSVRQLSGGLAMVTADGYRYTTEGQELDRYSLTYTLRKVENGWKIIVAILHDLGTPPPYRVGDLSIQ